METGADKPDKPKKISPSKAETEKPPPKAVEPTGKVQARSLPEAGTEGRAKPEVPQILLGKLLSEDHIIQIGEPLEKDHLIRRLFEILRRAGPDTGCGDALKMILARERESTTTLDTGLSLPHARVVGLSGIMGILAVVPQGLTDPDNPELSIRAMFLFLSPSDQNFFQRHIHLLRHLATLFQPALIDQLAVASSPQEILGLIRGREAAVVPGALGSPPKRRKT